MFWSWCTNQVEFRASLSRLLSSVQVPSKDLSEDVLAILLNDLAVARNNALKVPFVNSSHALVESRSIRCTERIPDESLLPDSRASCSVDLAHQLCEDTSGRVNISTRVLLHSRQVEQQISLNQSLGGLVVEHQLLVGVCVDIFSIELLVKRLINIPTGVVMGTEQMCPRQWFFLTLALLLQCVWANEFGVWEGFVPVVHEDVVLGVVGGNVFHGTHLVDTAADFVGESYGGEDGYGPIL
jgi:hypothetical protein